MSSVEEAELKAGHPPADKVGGMRVARPHHAAPNDAAPKVDKKKDDDEEEVEPSPPTVNPHTQQVLIDGAIIKEQKAYTPEAVKHYHNKPQPSKEPKHHHQPKQHHIQQPRS